MKQIIFIIKRVLAFLLLISLFSCNEYKGKHLLVAFNNHNDPYNKIILDILKRKISEKDTGIQVLTTGVGKLVLSFNIDTTLNKDGFEISKPTDNQFKITGQNHRALLYGLGKFLRSADYSEKGLIPGNCCGVSFPEKPIRGIYFATHFGNYYYNAPEDNVNKYLEDLCLWGANSIAVWYDMHAFNGINDSASRARIQYIKRIMKAGNKLGLTSCMTYLANEGYNNSPVELRAECELENGYFKKPWGYYYREVCPHKKGGLDYILKTRDEFFREFSDVQIDNLAICPYDQGGCTCAACAPWGTNGYLYTTEKTVEIAKKYFPKTSITLSTWDFDFFIANEWSGLAEKFNKNKPAWIDYLMVEDKYGFPFIKKNGVPGGFKLVGFPEICMEGMYPWGCFGANPRPDHWQKYFQEADSFLIGAFPYSEGIYEDINKIIILQKLWKGSADVYEIIREYVGAEFGHAYKDSLTQVIKNLEINLYHDSSLVRRQIASQTVLSVRKINNVLPVSIRESWRWQILLIRAEIDNERFNSGLKRLSNKRITDWQNKLNRLYYVGEDTYKSMVPTYQESWLDQYGL